VRAPTRTVALGHPKDVGTGGLNSVDMTNSDLLVNDWHSQLNPTAVARIELPANGEEVRGCLARAEAEGLSVSLCGGRHAMGGQQFASGGVLLDTSRLSRVLAFDPDAGTVEVEAGIQWPELVQWLLERQQGAFPQWGILQKQTGVDAVSLGGSLAANIHSRGLRMQPIIGDVLAFTLIDAGAAILRCSRTENRELFRLAIGGYGLFGLIYSVTVRLGRRCKVERVVRLSNTSELLTAFEERVAEGYLYGDFQYSCDERDEARFLREGVFPCYQRVPDDTQIQADQADLNQEQWRDLVYWGHVDKARSYQEYTSYYLRTSGQVYWSDTHQLIPYDRGYHTIVDERMGASDPATEMIAEAFVPRGALHAFMEAVRADFLQHRTNVVYGTVRLVEGDDESFLAWAREPWICVIFNLHVEHTTEGLAQAQAAFRRLIDRAMESGGSYFPTYHRWASREQVLACYPQFPEFLRLKRRHDPCERFASDWYRHHCSLLEPRAKELSNQ
jgi:FAD/FMN-containing dehydrogenase